MCSACEAAEKNPKTGRFNAECEACELRALAQSPAAKDAMLGYPDELKSHLQQKYPDRAKRNAARVTVYGWIKKLE